MDSEAFGKWKCISLPRKDIWFYCNHAVLGLFRPIIALRQNLVIIKLSYNRLVYYHSLFVCLFMHTLILIYSLVHLMS